jgi:hypothetical protein
VPSFSRFGKKFCNLMVLTLVVGCGGGEQAASPDGKVESSTPVTSVDSIRQQVDGAMASDSPSAAAESLAVVIQENMQAIREANAGKEASVNKLASLANGLTGLDDAKAKASLAQVKATLAELK